VHYFLRHVDFSTQIYGQKKYLVLADLEI